MSVKPFSTGIAPHDAAIHSTIDGTSSIESLFGIQPSDIVEAVSVMTSMNRRGIPSQ
jgi:hypothetical protein